MSAETLAACSDRELVEQFRANRDEAAFQAILDRHGPMVFQVCRRALSSTADVEDAFQATFLILVRRGHTIRKNASLGSWLHGVARRTAIKLRTQSDRRVRREARSANGKPAHVTDDTKWGDLRGILDEELARLPETVRAPLVLCYLEGRTQDEAAAQLLVSKSTLRRQLERAREMLGRRLARRGVTLAAVLSTRLLSECAQGAGLSRALIARTAESASHTAANLAAPASVLPARVAALSDGVIKTMHYAKYKTIVAMLACCLALGFGLHQLSPELALAQDARAGGTAKPPATSPDIEPIDPDLVFENEVQKKLRLSDNQVRQLTEARDKGRESAADQTKRLADIDQRLKKLQEEMEKLNLERSVAYQQIHKAQGDQVKATIPKVLSRDAIHELRQMTLQRMQITDLLLNPKIRARLELNDEQIKKIQELKEKQPWAYIVEGVHTQPYVVAGVARQALSLDGASGTLWLSTQIYDSSRSDAIKVLTPQQREILERLSGLTFEKGK
jgi:RNA polymerase sigma factor (sigma-70 family)